MKKKILDWKTHINVQAAFQHHCHAGISKTIDMLDYTVKEDIRKDLIYAWKQELKGITIYRTGSRQRVVLNLKNVKIEYNNILSISFQSINLSSFSIISPSTLF